MSDYQLNIDGNIKAYAELMKSTLEYESADKNYVDENGNRTERRRISGFDEFKGGLSGFGLAFDLGATYDLTEDLRLSAAITDLGFISWKDAYQASSAGTWTFDGFEEDVYAGGLKTETNQIDDQLEAIGDDLEEIFSIYEDEQAQKTDTRALAATINVGAEYTLPAYRNLRFGFLYSGRLAGQYSWHSGMFSATVRPLKWLEYTANLSFTSTGVTGGMVLDLHAKHFNFFIGTDRFFGKLSKQCIPLKSANGNISLGMSIPF